MLNWQPKIAEKSMPRERRAGFSIRHCGQSRKGSFSDTQFPNDTSLLRFSLRNMFKDINYYQIVQTRIQMEYD